KMLTSFYSPGDGLSCSLALNGNSVLCLQCYALSTKALQPPLVRARTGQGSALWWFCFYFPT
ncbi:hypothetical protein IKQ21_08515, partial [bacterium]|nr:hypothetical protein [bacterium]